MSNPNSRTLTRSTLKTLGIAATAAGMSSEKFLSRIDNLLRRRKCRDTNARGTLFSAAVLTALSSAM